MASDTTYTVEPKAAHTHTQTVIFLHGRDSNCREFAGELFESEASEPANQPRTLPDLFPGIRWVFSSAPILQSERFSTDISQWFDMWSVENPVERPGLQSPGLTSEQEMLVPHERIFLAGISQGFATAIAVFFAAAPRGFAGLIGLCSWMPAVLRAEDFQSFEDTSDSKSSRSTHVFLGHFIDDKVMPIKKGRDLRDTLQLQQLQVDWREYENGGHWVNEPQGMDDIARFINSTFLP
ncbi:lysophospholipase II [Nemania serpens]|nr:lysophospholipase II [Nemania serpens]